MSRPPRNLQPGFCYHITTRCNNREFRLTRLECREVFLYAIKKAQEKYGFKVYAVLSRDTSNFLQDGLKTLILQGIENLLHDSQKSRYLQRKIKPFEVILQVFSSISAQYLLAPFLPLIHNFSKYIFF